MLSCCSSTKMASFGFKLYYKAVNVKYRPEKLAPSLQSHLFEHLLGVSYLHVEQRIADSYQFIVASRHDVQTFEKLNKICFKKKKKRQEKSTDLGKKKDTFKCKFKDHVDRKASFTDSYTLRNAIVMLLRC